MLKPEVLIGEESRAGVLAGFNKMGRLLAITLGPIGGKIANSKHPLMPPELLTDAATIARRIIEVEDRVENVGAMMMRHLAWNVREEVGDGSAMTAVLAMAIANEFRKIVTAGANSMIVRRGIEKATESALKALDAQSLPLEGEERIAAVATASIGDPEIGRLLGDGLRPRGTAADRPGAGGHRHGGRSRRPPHEDRDRGHRGAHRPRHVLGIGRPG